jgi:hypothetical protein
MIPWGLTEGYFLSIVLAMIIAAMVVLIISLIIIVDATVDIKRGRLKVEEARENRLRAEAEERMGVKYEVVEEEEGAENDSALA